MIGMNKSKILVLILAGGKGGRLGLLTDNKAKPVIPFGGAYRLIDFTLSNCVHSGLADVWVVEQYQLHSLNEHLSNGRPWDLDRTRGGLEVLPPFENETGKDGFADGNADALFRQLDLIEEFAPDILLVLSADHVYKMDFRDVIEAHLKNRAFLTMVTTRLPPGESASRYSVVKTDKKGLVTKFDYKPDEPKGDLIGTEIFVYDARALTETLKKLAGTGAPLKDYGDRLLPEMVEQQKVYEYRHTGYWRDVGTIESYYESQMELLDEKRKIFFDDREWQVLTADEQRLPAFVAARAQVNNCLLGGGAKIYGHVRRSVLSAGVHIEKGAETEDSIILPNAVIDGGVKLRRVIVDTDVHVTKKMAAKLAAQQKNSHKQDIFIIGKRKIQSSAEIEE